MATIALILSSLMSVASAFVALFFLNFDVSTAFWLYMTCGIVGSAVLIATTPSASSIDRV